MNDFFGWIERNAPSLLLRNKSCFFVLKYITMKWTVVQSTNIFHKNVCDKKTFAKP